MSPSSVLLITMLHGFSIACYMLNRGVFMVMGKSRKKADVEMHNAQCWTVRRQERSSERFYSKEPGVEESSHQNPTTLTP